jgi:hypothetical protein
MYVCIVDIHARHNSLHHKLVTTFNYDQSLLQIVIVQIFLIINNHNRVGEALEWNQVGFCVVVIYVVDKS